MSAIIIKSIIALKHCEAKVDLGSMIIKCLSVLDSTNQR